MPFVVTASVYLAAHASLAAFDTCCTCYCFHAGMYGVQLKDSTGAIIANHSRYVNQLIATTPPRLECLIYPTCGRTSSASIPNALQGADMGLILEQVVPPGSAAAQNITASPGGNCWVGAQSSKTCVQSNVCTAYWILTQVITNLTAAGVWAVAPQPAWDVLQPRLVTAGGVWNGFASAPGTEDSEVSTIASGNSSATAAAGCSNRAAPFQALVAVNRTGVQPPNAQHAATGARRLLGVGTTLAPDSNASGLSNGPAVADTANTAPAPAATAAVPSQPLAMDTYQNGNVTIFVAPNITQSVPFNYGAIATVNTSSWRLPALPGASHELQLWNGSTNMSSSETSQKLHVARSSMLTISRADLTPISLAAATAAGDLATSNGMAAVKGNSSQPGLFVVESFGLQEKSEVNSKAMAVGAAASNESMGVDPLRGVMYTNPLLVNHSMGVAVQLNSSLVAYALQLVQQQQQQLQTINSIWSRVSAQDFQQAADLLTVQKSMVGVYPSRSACCMPGQGAFVQGCEMV